MKTNINAANNSLNFSGVYCDTSNMGRVAKELANKLEYELDYTKEIEKLEDIGVDVVILSNPNSKEDRAKVMFKTADDRLYKIAGKDYMQTGKTYAYPKADPEYSTNFDKIIVAARKILSGEIFKTTTKETQSIKQIKDAGLANSINNPNEFIQDAGEDFYSTISLYEHPEDFVEDESY